MSIDAESQAQIDRQLAMVDALRARGVKCFTFNGLSVEFLPPEVKPQKPAKTVSEWCNCKHHANDEHREGICLKGCDPVVCAGPE